MSLNGDLSIGVSALLAQSTAIGIVSNNISNSTTVGYKEGSPSFSDLIYQLVANGTPSTGNSSALGYFPSGVDGSNSPLNDVQGTINSTASPTDIAIDGSGFIPVSQTATSDGNIVYTRAGSFTADKNGDLVNQAGLFLQAWPLTDGALPSGVSGSTVSASSAISALQTVNVQKLSETPVATTDVTVAGNLQSSQAIENTDVLISANLQSTQTPYAGIPAYDATNPGANMASGAITPQFITPVTLVDSTGVSHNFNIGYINTSVNSWAYEVYAQPATDVTAANGQVGFGTLTFNNDGSLQGVNPSASPIPITWQDGALPSSLALNFAPDGAASTGITQQNAAYVNTAVTVQAYSAANPLENMTSGAIAPQFNDAVTIVDNTGAPHTFNVDFLKTATNTWAVEINAQPASDVVSANGGQIAAGTVTFNGDGTLATISSTLTQPLAVNWTNGAAASDIAFNWGTAGPPFGTPGATIIGRSDGLGQFDSGYTNGTTQNGIQPGTLSGIAIDDNGNITATYSNNTTQSLYKIPLANFIDPDQLQSQTGEVFLATANSGVPNFLQSGESGAGKIDPSALEASNVDLAHQLTDLIVAQDAYQAGSKLISTSETMLSDLVQMGAT